MVCVLPLATNCTLRESQKKALLCLGVLWFWSSTQSRQKKGSCSWGFAPAWFICKIYHAWHLPLWFPQLFELKRNAAGGITEVRDSALAVAGLPMWDDDEEFAVCFFVGFEWFRGSPAPGLSQLVPGGRWKLGSDGGHLHWSQSSANLRDVFVGRSLMKDTLTVRTEIP